MSERVRAKFKVTRLETSMNYTAKRNADGSFAKDANGRAVYVPAEMRTIVMHPVCSDDPQSENSKFWDASPSGELKLGTVNPAAWAPFTLDREFYLDFTPADL